MTEINITEERKRPREIFTAQFDRYEFDKPKKRKRIYFTNVKNHKGVLVKECLWISEKAGRRHNLIGNMAVGEVLFFSARIEMNPAYEDGFKLVSPICLVTK